MKMKKIGIIGGLGPVTTADFYLKIVDLSKSFNRLQHPSILIFNLPLTNKVEKDVAVKAQNMNSILPFLLDGVRQMEMAQVDFIVIPCNTVHVFIQGLRASTTIPILSIIEETVDRIKINNFKKVGLLATKETIKNNLFVESKKQEFEIVVPIGSQQNKISEIIGRILENKIEIKDKVTLMKIIEKLKSRGAEAVILGCTDLPLLINTKDSSLPLLNTLDILASSATELAFSRILKSSHHNP